MSASLAGSSSSASSSLSSSARVELRWQGRLLGVQRHRVGDVVRVGGVGFVVLPAGVEVDGAPRRYDDHDDGVVGLRCGPLHVLVSNERPIAAAIGETSIDLAWWRTAAIVVILMIGLLVATALTPVLPHIDVDDLRRGSLTIARVTPMHPPKREEQPKTTKKPAAATAPKMNALAASAKDPGAKKNPMKIKREADQAIAMRALAEMGLSSTPTSATGSVFGQGNAIEGALANLSGAGIAGAGVGLGTRGIDQGGVGVGIGLGSIGTNSSRTPGKGPTLDVDGRGHTGVGVKVEKITYVGGLDRGQIQRVMDRAMSRIRYCYERALVGEPDLEGKLTTLFMIGGGGDVISTDVVQSTLSKPVDTCVLGVLKTLKFPAPNGGGTVNVTYPFVFTAK
ncbi:MAG TPA: AgmX/PglI C-terminal domain-containing protein [Myxococcota bacterium]